MGANETKKTGRRNASGRYSPGKKLRPGKASSAAAGEKLRFDSVSNNVEKGQSHGRTIPAARRTAAVISGTVHSKLDRDADDNAGTDALNRGSQFAERVAENGTNAFSRWQQRHAIKKEYAAVQTGKTTGSAVSGAVSGGSASAKTAEKAAKGTKKVTERVSEFISEHWHGLLVGGSLLLVIMLIVGAIGSCSVLFQGGTNVVIDTSYTAEDSDILAVEADYSALEYSLQTRINNIQIEYPDYDEYNIAQDQIGHNPYELASYLTVVFENYKRNQVQGTLQQIFAAQYELTVESVVETRYRTETRTEIVTYTDPETGETYEEEEEYEEEVPYDYYILCVSLRNHGLSSILLSSGLTDDQMMRYGLLMQTLGNKPDIFSDNPYAIAVQEVLHYDIPGEALTDERFRRMITEAEKYLGYPYVWGGSSPSTSFDCSGFVCWVVNHCGNGWDVGRTTAEGLRNICAIIPKSAAKPGDLIFFQGTYNTYGASHVGIYVGDNMMLHCGNPIQYTSIDNSYWQAHFYCFGRLP